MANYVPPVKGGKVIGRPYQGTHGRAFNKKGGSDNWESENAVDIAVPVGTPVYAVADGVIGNQFGSLGKSGRFAGERLHLNTPKGEFYYGHLASYAAGITPGTHVTAGQLLGYSGSANGVAHLHFATSTNIAPMKVLKGLPLQGEQPVKLPGINEPSNPHATTPDASGAVAPIDPNLVDQQSAAISAIPQVGGAPQASAPLSGDQADFAVTPQRSTGDTWQLIASQGQVSQDTLRLAQLASLGNNASG